MDFMQYIHTSKKSGTLHLKNGSGVGRVHFENGQIIRAGRPGMVNLGDLLLEQNQISNNDLRSAVRIQECQTKAKPLGMILEEMGVITHRVVKDAVIHQIEQVIYELITWEEGTFNFELENYEPVDDISVAPDDLIPPEEIDTKLLLIEAMRIFEETKNCEPDHEKDLEGLRDHDHSPNSQSALNLKDSNLCRLPPAGFENFEQSLSLLKNMLIAGRGNDKTQSISVNFLKILSQHLDRAILFMVRRGELLGLSAFGKTLGPHSLKGQIKNLRIPLEPDSLLVKCIESRSPFCGEPDSQSWLNVLHQRIGTPITSEVMILPVAGVGRVICMVYGDNGTVARPINHLELLEIAAGQAGIIFENTTLRKQVQRKTH